MRPTLAHRIRRQWGRHGVEFLFITVRIIKVIVTVAWAFALTIWKLTWALLRGMFISNDRNNK